MDLHFVRNQSGNMNDNKTRFSGVLLDNPGKFSFRNRSERIDWRKLAALDVESLSRNLDFTTLQENIMNIAFCDLQSELDSRTDPTYIKLFRLAQLIIEYLLHSQDYLLGRVQDLGQNLSKEQEDHKTTRKEQVDKLQKELKDLKQELKKRNKIIAVQQLLLHGHNNGKSLHKCIQCGKTFETAQYLKDHTARRHPEINTTSLETSKNINEQKQQSMTVSAERERELEEIRQRLKQTEAALLEERNARNTYQEREKTDKLNLEEELNTRMEAWKMEQVASHKSALDKLKKRFEREMKQMTDKQRESEIALEEVRNIRSQGTTLGTLQPDQDAVEAFNRRNLEKEELENMRENFDQQLQDMESLMKQNLQKQEKSWRIKLENINKEHNNQIKELNDMFNERLLDLESMRAVEGRESLRPLSRPIYDDDDYQDDDDDDDDEVNEKVAKISAEPPKPPPREEPPSAVEPPVVKKIEREEGSEEEISEQENEEPVVEKKKQAQMKILTTKQLLDRAIKNNPDLLQNHRDNVLEELELKLNDYNIKRNADKIDERKKQATLELIGKDQKSTSKKFKSFFQLRENYAAKLDKDSMERFKHYLTSIGIRANQSGRLTDRSNQSTPRSAQSSSHRPASHPSGQSGDRNKERESKTILRDDSRRGKVSATNRNSAPELRSATKSKQSPRVAESDKRIPGKGNTDRRMNYDDEDDDDEDDIIGDGRTTHRSSNWDSEEEDGAHQRVSSNLAKNQPRPRAKTPRQSDDKERQELGQGRQELGQSRQDLGQRRQELGQGRQDLGQGRQELGQGRGDVGQGQNMNIGQMVPDSASEVDSDDLSELVKSQEEFKNSSVKQLSKSIEIQLKHIKQIQKFINNSLNVCDKRLSGMEKDRNTKKPVGSVDILPVHTKTSKKVTSSRDAEDDLLTSISSMDLTERPTPKPRASGTVRSSFNSIPTTISTNTFDSDILQNIHDVAGAAITGDNSWNDSEEN